MVPGDGRKPFGGVLGVDAALDRVAAVLDVVLGERQRLAGRDAELLGDEVELGDLSVTQCSTWRRVFISRNQNSPSW